MTHLTLTVLRDEVRSNKPVRIFRIVGMGILVVMLIYVLWHLGYQNSNLLGWDLPAWCLYRPGIEWRADDYPVGHKRYNIAYIAVTMSILIHSFVTRVLLLRWDSGRLIHALLRIPLEQPWRMMESWILKLENEPGHNLFFRIIKTLGSKLLRSFYDLLVTGHDLYQSKVWEVIHSLLFLWHR
jgi:hypothetical protein